MNRKISIKILIAFVGLTILLIFNSLPAKFDSFLFSSFNLISGEIQPDSSIVIIHVTSQDIEQLGPWPLKRSYYALLINNLNKYGVKKIGLEIFLSSKFVSQTIYDNVLQREIGRANNVVLSSIAGSLVKHDGIFTTDSLSYPSPKLINENIPTGHINYFQDRGIEIPLKIFNQNEFEKAFCIGLISGKDDYPGKIKINISSSWNKFNNYSLVQFLQSVQDNDEKLLNLKNKFVIIGISDPQLAASFSTTFDEQLPGVALHAFALDNLLNNRFINDNYYQLSKYLLFIIAFALIILLIKRTKIIRYYAILFLSSLILTFVLYKLLYLEIAYSFLFIPFLFVFASDIYFMLIEKNNELTGYYNESEILKKLLAEKEKALLYLETELSNSASQKTNILLKK